ADRDGDGQGQGEEPTQVQHGVVTSCKRSRTVALGSHARSEPREDIRLTPSIIEGKNAAFDMPKHPIERHELATSAKRLMATTSSRRRRTRARFRRMPRRTES